MKIRGALHKPSRSAYDRRLSTWRSSLQDDYRERSAMPLVERRGSKGHDVVQIAPIQRFLVASQSSGYSSVQRFSTSGTLQMHYLFVSYCLRRAPVRSTLTSHEDQP